MDSPERSTVASRLARLVESPDPVLDMAILSVLEDRPEGVPLGDLREAVRILDTSPLTRLAERGELFVNPGLVYGITRAGRERLQRGIATAFPAQPDSPSDIRSAV